MFGHLNGSVDEWKDIVRDEVSLAKYPNTCAVSIEEFALLYKLLELHFRHGHQSLDLGTRPVKVFDAEGIDSHHLDTGLVADVEYLWRGTC
jgi:hypothetical protein